jgi:hypothetical protein
MREGKAARESELVTLSPDGTKGMLTANLLARNKDR